MIRRKGLKRFAAILMVAMMIGGSTTTIALAAENNVANTEFNPFTMTHEERVAWVEANCPTYTFDATDSAIARNNWLSTGTKTVTFGPTTPNGELLYSRGNMKTKVDFLCDANYTMVLDWSTAKFEVTPQVASAVVETDVTVYRISDNNVKITYEAWVAIEEGSYHVMQIYNLHGNGAYSYTPSFNGPY